MVPNGLLRKSLGRIRHNKTSTYIVDGVERHYRDLGWHMMVSKGMSAVWDNKENVLWNGSHVTDKEYEIGRVAGGRHIIQKKEEWIYVILNEVGKKDYVKIDLRVGAQEVLSYLLKDCKDN